MDPYNAYSMFHPTMPTTQVSVPQTTAYSPNYDPSSQIGQLLERYGGTLAPMTAFTQRLAPANFYRPFQESMSAWEKTFARPEYMQRTRNPFVSQWANQAAAGGLSQMGGGRKRYRGALDELESGYSTQMDQAREQMNQYVEGLYQQRLQSDADSPTAFRAGGSTGPGGYFPDKTGGYGLF